MASSPLESTEYKGLIEMGRTEGLKLADKRFASVKSAPCTDRPVFKPLFSLKLEVPVHSVSASKGSEFLQVAKTDHEWGSEMTS